MPWFGRRKKKKKSTGILVRFFISECKVSVKASSTLGFLSFFSLLISSHFLLSEVFSLFRPLCNFTAFPFLPFALQFYSPFTLSIFLSLFFPFTIPFSFSFPLLFPLAFITSPFVSCSFSLLPLSFFSLFPSPFHISSFLSAVTTFCVPSVSFHFLSTLLFPPIPTFSYPSFPLFISLPSPRPFTPFLTSPLPSISFPSFPSLLHPPPLLPSCATV